MAEQESTPFSCVYDSFLAKITDDMYIDEGFTEFDTYKMMEELLISAIPKFEFPRVSLDYEVEEVVDEGEYSGVESNGETVTAFYINRGKFLHELSREEINILATYMVVEWLGQQLASIENTRIKITGADFKMSSQANHMAKLNAIKKEYEKEGFHLQRLYKRRRSDETGIMRSTFGDIMASSVAQNIANDNR